VLAGTAQASPKGRDGIVESIRALRTVRRGAIKARSAALDALQAMVASAPVELRECLDGVSTRALLATCAALRPDEERRSEAPHATKAALRSLARRIAALEREIAELTAELAPLVGRAAPQTIALMAIGVEHAGQPLVTAGDNRDRLRFEAAFAHLCCVAPIPASSRHTRACVQRRTREGLSKMEIIRCLKRHLAREVFHTLRADLRELHGFDGLQGITEHGRQRRRHVSGAHHAWKKCSGAGSSTISRPLISSRPLHASAKIPPSLRSLVATL
jgi:transposase